MSNELSKEEITILSAQYSELYAYIGVDSLGKSWPPKIVCDCGTYALEAKWELPVEMRSYIQAARYKRA